MKLGNTITVIALMTLFASPILAAESLTTGEMITRVEESLKDCNWHTRNLKGAPLGKMLLHKKTMEDVLEALKAGRDVESGKLDTALTPHRS